MIPTFRQNNGFLCQNLERKPIERTKLVIKWKSFKTELFFIFARIDYDYRKLFVYAANSLSDNFRFCWNCPGVLPRSESHTEWTDKLKYAKELFIEQWPRRRSMSKIEHTHKNKFKGLIVWKWCLQLNKKTFDFLWK